MKKHTLISVLLLLLYCIPCAFLAMYADDEWNTAWVYFPALLLPAVLGWFCGKTGRIGIGIAGNFLSAASSVLFAFAFGNVHWVSYFKPFGPMGMLFLLWVIPVVVQTLFWRRYQKSTLTYALLFISLLLLLTSFILCQFLALVWPHY